MAKKEAKQRPDLKGLNIKAIIALLNKEHGEGTLVLASKADNSIIDYISTGCFELDFGMGGGFPKNRITHVQGPYSSLKSTTSLTAIAAFQKLHKDGIAAIVDVERAFDMSYARVLGVDLERLIVVTPDTGEQAADAFIDLLESDYDFFGVIDSLAAMVPTAILDADMMDQFMGGNAKLINRMMSTCVGRMKRSMYNRKAPSTTVVALNQEREKIGVIYGSPIYAPGGKGKEFMSSVLLRLYSSKSDAIIEEIERNGIKRKIRFGQKCKFAVIKNKCGASQFEEGEFEYYIRPHGVYLPNQYNNLDSLHRYGTFFGEIPPVATNQRKKYLMELAKDANEQARLYNDILVHLRNQDEDIATTAIVPVKKKIVLIRKKA